MLKKMMKFSVACLIGIVFYLLGLYAVQDKLIFHPDKFYIGPEEAGVPEFGVRPFVSFGGQMNMGWYLEGDKDKPLILFFHGNAGQLATFAPNLYKYAQAGYSIFMPEYRGFGSTGGELNEDTMYTDAVVAFDFVKEVYEPEKIVVFGYSMGTAPASALSKMRNPDALILAAPFYSLEKEVADKKIPLSGIVLKNRLESYKYVSEYEGALLVIHGSEDKLIRPEHGKNLFELSISADKQFVLLDGVNHNQLFFHERNHQPILDWLEKQFQ